METLRECYTALGVIHNLWRPIPGEFDDYIATPKDNMYRALHTAVVGPEGKPLEVQIRTHEMNYMAELGPADPVTGSRFRSTESRCTVWLEA